MQFGKRTRFLFRSGYVLRVALCSLFIFFKGLSIILMIYPIICPIGITDDDDDVEFIVPTGKCNVFF